MQSRYIHCRARDHNIAACPRLADILHINTKASDPEPALSSSSLPPRPPPVHVHRPSLRGSQDLLTTTTMPPPTSGSMPLWYPNSSAGAYSEQALPPAYQPHAFPSHTHTIAGQSHDYADQYQCPGYQPPPPGVDSWIPAAPMPSLGSQYPSPSHRRPVPITQPLPPGVDSRAFDPATPQISSQSPPTSRQYELLTSPFTRSGLDPWTPTSTMLNLGSQSSPLGHQAQTLTDQPEATDSESSTPASPTLPFGSRGDHTNPTTGILGMHTVNQEGSPGWKAYISKLPGSRKHFTED